jgi:multidrug resistance efflux pump
MSVQLQGPQRQTIEPTPPPDGHADGHARPTAPSMAPTNGVDGPVAPAIAAPNQVPAARQRPAFLTRRVLLPVLGVVVVVAAIFGFNTWREGQLYVSTDNAQLSGQPVQVGAMNAGRVSAIMPPIGGAVRKGDVVAQVALPSQVGVAQAGQPKMDFLGVGDTHVDVLAPVDGIVIAEPVPVGSTVQAGQPIVSVVDPSQLWVNANIEETNVGRIRVGQPVTVHVDALGGDIPGKVEVVTPATAGVFSILPSSNASGNFTKVTQLVPVRISVNLGNQPLLLGANVEVKIRVAD